MIAAQQGRNKNKIGTKSLTCSLKKSRGLGHSPCSSWRHPPSFQTGEEEEEEATESTLMQAISRRRKNLCSCYLLLQDGVPGEAKVLVL